MLIDTATSRRSLRISALAVTFLSVLCCMFVLAIPALAQAPARGGTLVLGIEADPDVLDPHVGTGWVTWRVDYQIYEGLVKEDLTVKPTGPGPAPIVPSLAASWDVSADGATYTFRLRKGVKFHDGTDFNAEAVLINFERMGKKDSPHYYDRAGAFAGLLMRKVKDVKVVDSHTVAITLMHPWGDFLRQIGQFSPVRATFISPTALKKWGNTDIAEHPVGTGPFEFVERVRGQKIVLKRNENHWGTKAHLDRVIFRPLPEAAARVTALQTGEVHMIIAPPLDSVEPLRAQGFSLQLSWPPHVWFYSLNTNQGYPTSDVRVRRAIQMAINKEAIATQLLKGTASPAHQMFAPSSPAFDPNFKMYSYDPAAARKLLAEAGYAGTDVKWMTSVSGSGQIAPVQITEMIQADLAKVGVKMKMETYEWIAYIYKQRGGLQANKADASQMSWGMTTNTWLNFWTNSRLNYGGRGPVGDYKNLAYDDLVEQAERQTDQAAMVRLYRKAHEMLMTDAAYLPIIHDRAPIILGPKVRGFVNPNQEAWDLSIVSLAK
ncbi:MAG: ABC transporter substrate-binding protein [Candidatus Rokuibacteriota bacterium]